MGRAHELETSVLPSDIAVKSDALLQGMTAEAMNFWTAKLSTPDHQITWHLVTGLDECHIYVKRGYEAQMNATHKGGLSRMPGDPFMTAWLSLRF